MYYDDSSQANHFNLLLLRGPFNAPLPENTAFSVSVDLDNTGNSYASAVKQTFSSVNYNVQSIKVTGSKQACQAPL